MESAGLALVILLRLAKVSPIPFLRKWWHEDVRYVDALHEICCNAINPDPTGAAVREVMLQIPRLDFERNVGPPPGLVFCGRLRTHPCGV